MKKSIYIAASLAIGLFAQAQNMVIVDKNGGTVKINRDNISEVYFKEAPEYTEANTLLYASYATKSNYALYEIQLGTGAPDANGDPAEPGDVQLALLLIGEQSADVSNAQIPQGYYMAGTGYTLNTFNAEGSAIWSKGEDGSVDVRLDGSVYDIRCELQTLSGYEYDLSYSGEIEFTIGASEYTDFTEPQNITFDEGQGRFYGNWYNPFAHDAMLQFYSGDFDNDGYQIEGYWLNVDMYMPKVVDPMNQQQVVDGVYTLEPREKVLDYTYLPYTFIRGGELEFWGMIYQTGTYVTYVDRAGNRKIGYINGGTITVSESGTKFDFDFLTDNGVSIKGTCSRMSLENYCDNATSEPQRPYSTLTEDYSLSFPASTVADEYNLGDYIVGGLNNFMLIICDANVVTGDYLSLELMADAAQLVDGTYRVENSLTDKTVIVGCASSTGQPAFSWFGDLSSTDDEGYQTVMAPISGGSLTIETLSDGRKTLTFDLQDDKGNKITGSWTGTVNKGSLTQAKPKVRAKGKGFKMKAPKVIAKDIKKPVEARLMK